MLRTRLFIDRISFTIPVDIGMHDVVLGHLEHSVSTGHPGQTGQLTRIAERYSPLRKGYRHAYRLRLHGDSFCFIQIAPYRPTNYLRIEWNPATARSESCQNPFMLIAGILEGCFPEEVDIVAFLENSARLTRIDLTFDLRRIPVASILVNTRLGTTLSGQYWQLQESYSGHGKLNARYVGKRSSDRYLLIYDKDAQERMRQIADIPELESRSMLSATRTRFELRIRPKMSLSDFLRDENPFEAYTVGSFERVFGPATDFNLQCFALACQLEGSQAVLSLIGNRRKRAKYESIVRAAYPLWWSAEAIWAEREEAIRKVFCLDVPSDLNSGYEHFVPPASARPTQMFLI